MVPQPFVYDIIVGRGDMMSISFRKIEDRMKFKNPFKAFSMDELSFEIRYDPLTGQTSRVFDLAYEPIEKPDFKALAKQSPDMPCPFCPESIGKATTLYPDEIVPEGRLNVGKAHIFPNLLPLDRYTGVCVMTKAHFVALEDTVC